VDIVRGLASLTPDGKGREEGDTVDLTSSLILDKWGRRVVTSIYFINETKGGKKHV